MANEKKQSGLDALTNSYRKALSNQKPQEYEASGRTARTPSAFAQNVTAATTAPRMSAMDMAIDSLRNRVAVRRMGEWAKNATETYTNHKQIKDWLRNTPEGQKYLIDYNKSEEERQKAEEIKRRQDAITLAQDIDVASSLYEPPTKRELVKVKDTNMDNADMFSNDWEPVAGDEHEEWRTVQNERYNPLAREERDALIDSYYKAMMGGADSETYHQIMVDVAKNGGIQQLVAEQKADAESDRNYSAKLNYGINLDDMSLLQRAGKTAGNLLSGTEKQWLGQQMAGIETMATPPEAMSAKAQTETFQADRDKVRDAAWDYVSALVGRRLGGVNEQEVSAARNALNSTVMGDYYLADETYDPNLEMGDPRNAAWLRVADQLNAVADRIAEGDSSITKDNILDFIQGGNLSEQVKKAFNDDQFQAAYENLLRGGAEDLDLAKAYNPIAGGFGDMVIDAASSSLSSAQSVLLSRMLLGGAIKGLGEVQTQLVNKLANAGAANFIVNSAGFVGDRLRDILGMAAFGVESYGGYAFEARQKMLAQGIDIGVEEARKIKRYAGTNTNIELATEMLFSSIGAIKNVSGNSIFNGFADSLGNVLGGLVSDPAFARSLRKLGGLIGGGTEEGLEELIGNVLRQMFDASGIIGEEDQTTISDYITDYLVGFMSGLMGETTNVIYSQGNRQRAGDLLLNNPTEAGITYQQLYDIAANLTDENASGDASSLRKAYETAEKNGKGGTTQNAGRLYEAYTEYMENVERAENAVDKALEKAREGGTITRSDLNRILQSETAMEMIAEETGAEITGESTSERRDNLRTALEALASDSVASEQAQAENVAQEEENANTAVSAPNPFLVMSQSAIDNALQQVQPMSTAESLRAEADVNASNKLLQNMARSIYSVSDAAERLGASREAADTMARLYSPSQGDTVTFTGQAMKYVNQGGNNEALDLTDKEDDVLTPIQKRAFWNVGRMEYLREVSQNGETKQAENGELRVHDSGEWNDSAYSAGSPESMAEVAGGNQAGQSGYQQPAAAASGIRQGAVGRRIASDGVDAKTMRSSMAASGYKLVNDVKDQDYAKVKKIADSHGYDLVAWRGGLGNFDGTRARGLCKVERNDDGSVKKVTLFVQLDNDKYTAEQTAIHEATHGDIATGKITLPEAKAQMIKALGGEDNFYAALDAYADAYHAGGALEQDENGKYSEKDLEAIFEEMVCDAPAGMNAFAEVQHFDQMRQFRPAMSAAKAATENRNPNGTRGSPAERGSLGKASIDLTADALGVDAYRDEAGKVHFRVDGREVKEITAEHVKNRSAIGVLIKAGEASKFITAAEANEQYQAAADLMNMIMSTQDPEMIWAFSGATMFSALKKNSDGQYGTTIDFTTVCRKTQEMVTAMSNAMREAGRGLTKEEVTKLQHDVLESGAEVPCPVCYVFSRWAGIGGMLDEIVRLQDKYAKFTKEQVAARTNELKKEIIARGLGSKDKKGRPTVTGSGATALMKELKAEADDAKAKIEWYEDGKKGVVTEAEYKRLKKELPPLLENIGILSEWTWASQIVTRADYKAVPKDILFDLDAGAKFASEYPAVWKYRTTRGPSSGKAILPYSSMRTGDIITGADPSATVRALFTDKETNKSKMRGKMTKKQDEAYQKAVLRTAAQNLIGGQRYQSTSDFRYEYALDYIQSFWELQALGSKLQTYTKVVEYADIIAAVGGDVNLSVMPLRSGVENGKLIFSNQTGMNIGAALEANRKFDNAQLILVGINDEHILAALDDHHGTGGENIGFVIPYHASGASITDFISELVKNLGERFVNSNYRDYSAVQNDKEKADRTAEQIMRAEIRKKLLTGKTGVRWNKANGAYESNVKRNELTKEELDLIRGKSVDISDRTFEDLRNVELKALAGDKAAIREYLSWSAGVLNDLYEKMYNGAEKDTVLNSSQAEHIMPHEYWNTNTTRANAYVNGFIFRSYCYSMGLMPRFSWSVGSGENAHGDLSGSDGYWKTLIDRPMYNNDGTYRAQQRINVTDFNNAMLKPSYAEKTYPKYKIQEPNRSRAEKVGAEFGKKISGKLSQDLDSAGNQLTEQQAEYFKDSKVRDENGKLMVMYHGTSSNFTVFDRGKIGAHGSFEGAGFNFTPSKSRASGYTNIGSQNGRVMGGYLNIANPLSSTKKTISVQHLAKVIREIDPTGDNIIANYANDTRDYGTPAFVRREALVTARAIYDYSDNDVDIYSEMSSAASNPEEIIAAFQKMGYDGLIHYSDNGKIKTAITFDSNQFKNMDNKNPTSNPDIRYSLDLVDPVEPSSEAWKRTKTTEEAMRIYPNLWNVAAEESEKRNPTQVSSTQSTYRRIYDILKKEGFSGKILDASSGLGIGTRVGREEYGFDVDDIEPYPGDEYEPKYRDYSKLNKKYDAIISSAVLNVLPQDQRDALVVKMGKLLNPGGRIFVTTRGKEVEDSLKKSGKNIRLDNMEWIETSRGSYQKGFTDDELKAYLEDALGNGFTVEKSNASNGGRFNNNTSIVVTKNAEAIRFSRDLDTQYMAAAESGDTETAAKLVKQAAEEAGYTVEGYHGTEGFGFTRIDTNESDDGASFFVTNSPETASTYSGTDGIRTISATVDYSIIENEKENLRRNVMKILRDSGMDMDVSPLLDDIVEGTEQMYEDAIDEGISPKTIGNDMGDWYDLVDGMSGIVDGFIIDYQEAHPETADDWFDVDYGEIVNYTLDYLSAVSMPSSGNYHLFVNPDGLLVIDAKGANWNAIHFVPENMDNVPPRLEGAKSNTRNIAKYAKSKGYSGVLFKNLVDDGGRGKKRSGIADVYALFNPQVQVKSADPITYDEDGNIIPLEERFNPKNDDIRFSRDLSNTELYEANRQLQKDLTELRSKLKTRTEQYKYWKGQTKTTEGRQLRIEDVTKLAREIIKGQESSADAKAVAEKMKALGEYLLNSQEDNVYDEARLKAYEIAHDILANAKTLNAKGGDDFYADFRTALKNQPIYVAPSAREEVAPDGWNDFRKAQFGTVNMTADQSKGKSVDTVYHDLQATFGEWLLPEYITSEADQLNKILEVIETYRPVYENLNSYEMADAVEWTANEILTRIIGEEIRETNPTYADRMEKKLAGQKAKAQTALTQVRQQRDRKVADLKAHYQQVAEDRRNRKIDSEMRSRLLKIAKRLNNKKLDRVTRGLLDQYIGELDLVSKGILDRTIKDIEHLNDFYNAYKEKMGADFIEDISIKNRIDRLSKKHINDLTQEEVAELTTVLLNFENMLRTKDKLLESQIKSDVYAAGMQTIDDIANSNGKTGFLAEYIGAETASPERYIHRITGYRENSPLYQAAKELSDGQRKMLDYQRRAEALFKKWTTDKKFIRRIAGKHAEAITARGYVDGVEKELNITPAMAMSLYLHAKNDDNMRHISQGGVMIPDMKLYLKGKLQDAYANGERVVFTRSMIAKITSQLDEKEIAFADAVGRYYNTMSRDEINNVSEILKGFAIAGVENYFPIHTNGNFLAKTFDTIKRDGSIEGMGFLKERIDNASTPIMLFDLNTILNRSISQHSKYVGLAIPVRNFEKLYNVTTFTDNGVDFKANPLDPGWRYDTSIATTLEKNWGKAATSYVAKMMADIENGTGLKDDKWGDLLAQARSKYAGAVLTTNASVAMKQAASYPTAAAVVGYKALGKALADFRKYGGKTVDMDKLAEYTPLYWYRSKGFSTTELGDIGKEGGHIPKALNWIQGIDMLTTRKLAKAAMYYVADHNKDLVKGTDAWWKEVARVYNRIIEETQPNYTMMQRPQILRSDNALTRALQMFKTQPFQNFNILYDAFGNLAAKSREYKANPTEESRQALKSARTNAVRAVTSQAVSAFIFALMQFAWDAFRGKVKKYRDKDDEKDLLSWLKGIGLNVVSSVGGMLPFGSYALELGEAMTDAILKGLKKDPVFDQTFYGLSENATESMNDMGNALLNIVSKTSKTLEAGELTESSVRSLADSVEDIAQFAGVPVKNVVNLMQAIARNVILVAEEDDFMARYKALRITTDPAKYKSDYYSLLEKAYRYSDSSYGKLYNALISDKDVITGKESFATESNDAKANIDASVKKWGYALLEDAWKNDRDSFEELREKMLNLPGDPFATSSKTAAENIDAKVKEWKKEETESDSVYQDALDLLKMSDTWKDATDKEKKAAENNLLNIAAGTNEDLAADAAEAKAAGMDETEYVLFKIALSMADKDKSGGVGNKELLDVINEGNYTDEQKAVLWKTSSGIDPERVEKVVSGGKSVGLTETEYMLYRMALPMFDADGNGSYTKAEVEAAIRSMKNLTNAEKAYLFSAQYPKTKTNPFK